MVTKMKEEINKASNYINNSKGMYSCHNKRFTQERPFPSPLISLIPPSTPPPPRPPPLASFNIRVENRLRGQRHLDSSERDGPLGHLAQVLRHYGHKYARFYSKGSSFNKVVRCRRRRHQGAFGQLCVVHSAGLGDHGCRVHSAVAHVGQGGFQCVWEGDGGRRRFAKPVQRVEDVPISHSDERKSLPFCLLVVRIVRPQDHRSPLHTRFVKVLRMLPFGRSSHTRCVHGQIVRVRPRVTPSVKIVSVISC